MRWLKREKKDLGRSPEQSMVIIENSYSSELLLDDNNYAKVAKNAFKSNPDAFAVIDKLCSAVGKLEFLVYQQQVNGKKKYIDKHPFLELIKRPNADKGKFDYLYELVLFFILSGQMFQRKITVSGSGVTALYVCRPDTMGMLLNNSTQAGWYFDYKGTKRSYKLDEISYLRIPDPLDDFKGFSPLRAAAYNIDGNNENDKWNFSMLKNGARPSGILKTSQVLNDTVVDRLKKSIQAMWSGGVNAGKTQILDGGLEWQQLSMSAKDMDNINYSKLNSRKIAQVLGVPNELIGDSEAKTYNSYNEAKTAFYNDSVLAIAQRLIDEWNRWVMPHWGTGLYIEVNKEIIEALREDADSLSVRVLAQYASGVITRAEAREALGYKFVSGDEVYKTTFSDIFIKPNEPVPVATSIADATADPQAKSIEVKKNISISVTDDILDQLDADEYYDDMIDTYSSALAAEGTRVLSTVVGSKIVYQRTKEATKYLEKTVLSKSKKIIDETLRKKIGTQIIEGMNEGEGAYKIRDRVEQMFKDSYYKSDVPNHAEMIARTEALTSVSVATNDAYTQSGVVEATEWLTTLDGRERDWHAELNGEVVELGEEFVSGNGNRLRYPRDPLAPAEEVINCRCAVAPIVKGQKAIYDTLEKKEAFWRSEDAHAEKYVKPFLNAIDKAMKKQFKKIETALLKYE